MKINARAKELFALNAVNFEEVSKFVYLGSKITTDDDCEKAVQSRISKEGRHYNIKKHLEVH